MCSVTKDVAKACASMGMTPWKTVLVGSAPCMLWIVIVLWGVVATTQSGYEWELYVLLLLRVVAKAIIISIAIRKGQEKRATAAAQAESGTVAAGAAVQHATASASPEAPEEQPESSSGAGMPAGRHDRASTARSSRPAGVPGEPLASLLANVQQVFIGKRECALQAVERKADLGIMSD